MKNFFSKVHLVTFSTAKGNQMNFFLSKLKLCIDLKHENGFSNGFDFSDHVQFHVFYYFMQVIMCLLVVFHMD